MYSSPAFIISRVSSEEWHEVVQLVEALLYKPEDCGFDSR
jgi:hypothetical protein